MNEKKEITINSDMIDQTKGVKRRPASEWMKDEKYSLVYGALVDYAYSLQIKPDMDDLTDYVNSMSKDNKYSKREIKAFIKALIQEGLISEGNDRNAIVVRGYKVSRAGKPLCAFCGGELNWKEEKVTKTNHVKYKYTCPDCGAAAEFKVKAKVEPTS